MLGHSLLHQLRFSTSLAVKLRCYFKHMIRASMLGIYLVNDSQIILVFGSGLCYGKRKDSACLYQS